MSSSVQWFDIGDLVKVAAEFAVGGVPTDPTTVALSVLDPLGAVVNYSAVDLANPAVGKYYIEITPDTPGAWQIRWIGTGACQSVIVDQFMVRRDAFEGVP